MYAYIFVCMYVFIYIYIYIYVSMYICMYECVCIYVCVCLYVCEWVVSKNTQTPKFQIFPGRLGSSKRLNLGVCPKNRKGGGAPPFYPKR